MKSIHDVKILDKNKLLFLLLVLLFLPGKGNCAQELSHADSLLLARKHFSFAVQHKQNGDNLQALKQYEQSLAYNDTVFQIHYSYADLLMEMNRSGDAKQHLLQSLALNPEHYNSALVLAKIYYDSAAYDSTLFMYEMMYHLKPDNSEVLMNIAHLREYLGMKKESLSAYKELLGKGFDSYENLMKTVGLAIDVGDYACAENSIEQVIQEHPGNSGAFNTAAKVFSLSGKHDDALLYLNQIQSADSIDVILLEELETAFRSHGHTEQLISAFKLHHQISPRNKEIIGELTELLYTEGRIEESVVYIDNGLELSPDDGKLRILKGEYYLSKELTQQALHEFEIALKDDEWGPSAQRLIWKIEKPVSESEKTEQEFFKRGRNK